MIKALIANAEALDINAQDVVNIAQGKTKVVAYHLLAQYSTIDELLAEFDCAVILWEIKEWSGHFTAVYRDEQQQLHYFDPYGMSPMKDRTYATWDDANTPPLLQQLLEGTGFIQNKVEYQQWSADVNTCGRWTGLRVRTRLTVSAERFQQLFHAANGDMWVSAITLLDTTRL